MPLAAKCAVRGCLVLALMVLAGCASVRPGAVAPENPNAALLALQGWEARGRIAFKSGAEGGQATLRWQQSADQSLIRLAGPFGAGAYDVTWAPERVSVANSDGEQTLEYRGVAAAEQFLQAQLGWSFPAGSTRYWMLGVLDPAAPGEEQRDEEGVLQVIRQHGWEVRFERFQNVQGYRLPARFELQNANASLRVVITRWALQPGSGS